MSEQLQPQSELLQYPRLFGLIGYPLSHSFSKKYFSQHFAAAGITDAYYELFPIESIHNLLILKALYPNLQGLNVTIPYKQTVMPLLDELDESAQAVGAVNTIHIQKGRLIGYNTDTYGFEMSLRQFLSTHAAQPKQALILGRGGAAKAVAFVLQKMGIRFQYVSRQKSPDGLHYDELTQLHIIENQLIINTTPLGMQPHIDTFPNIPYHCINESHLLFDLVYNPEETQFLKKGAEQGAATSNGLQMLYLQAERAGVIWGAFV